MFKQHHVSRHPIFEIRLGVCRVLISLIAVILLFPKGPTLARSTPDANRGHERRPAGIRAREQDANNKQNESTTSFQTGGVAVRVMGMGLFDFLHAQTGTAPNSIELHPIIDFQFDVSPRIPKIINAVVNGKRLLVSGLNFDDGAVVLLNGDKQKTRNDEESPTTLLIAKKAGKNIERGQTVGLQVRNLDGSLSEEFVFTRLTEPPTQLSPPDGAVFNNFPRATTLTWSAVPGAVSYTVEIDCFGCCKTDAWCADAGGPSLIVRGLTTTSYSFDFFGAQPGRWRVWAEGTGGQESPKTGWWVFRYTV